MISASCRQILIGAVLLSLASAAFADPAPQTRPHPDTTLDPASVVRIQLQALAQNDQPAPDSGLATAYEFASPANRLRTGSLQRFSAMVHTSYAALLNYRSAHFNPIVVKGDFAMQGVELVDQKGYTARYVFILSRQIEPPYAGCWMTDGVLMPPDNADRQGM